MSKTKICKKVMSALHAKFEAEVISGKTSIWSQRRWETRNGVALRPLRNRGALHVLQGAPMSPWRSPPMMALRPNLGDIATRRGIVEPSTARLAPGERVQAAPRRPNVHASSLPNGRPIG
jgi:hypothetical protein